MKKLKDDYLNMEEFLFQEFGFSAFREGQKEIIASILNQQDTFAVLSTGTGKSLCYQYAGRRLSGTVVIISPLLSLMEDQVRQLQKSGERRVTAFNSTLSYEEKRQVLANFSSYKFIFISPESLNKPAVLEQLQQMKIALFVIDEAHCVSQWGVDFRPEYATIKEVLKKMGYPLTLALTATASESVQKEIREYLFRDSSAVRQFIYSVNRENISLIVEQTNEKEQLLFDYLGDLTSNGIIYCSARKTAERLCQRINEQTGIQTAFYHGGLSQVERSKIQQQFTDNDIQLLCATNAFGMGIDKPDIRFILHYDCSASLENYVQEIGRAGRDGLPSTAVLFYQRGDEMVHQFFQNEVKAEIAQLASLLENKEQELPDFSEQLSEIQQKWFEGYLNGHYTIDELNRRIEEKHIEKYHQMKQMLDYIYTKDCRRAFILTYFSETAETENCGSCDNCEHQKKQLLVQAKPKTMEKLSDQAYSWEKVLIRLFKDEE